MLITETITEAAHASATMVYRAREVAEALRLDATTLDGLTTVNLTKAYQRLLDRGLSRSTVRTYVAAFKAVMRIMDVDTSKWPSTPKPSRVKAREPISTDDLKRVVSYMKEKIWLNTVSLVYALRGTGMRVNCEALDLSKWTLMHYMGHYRLRIIGKGGHERVVPVLDMAAISALSMMGSFGHMSYETHARRWAEAVKACGVESKLPTLHSIRHKYASDAMERCQNLEVVRQMMGHADIKTTARYIGVDLEQMRKALDCD